MLNLIKKLNKQTLALLLLLAAFGLLVPLQSARAGIKEAIAEGIRWIVLGSIDLIAGVLSLVFMLLQFITGLGPFLGAEYLNAVIGLNFEIPLTPATASPDSALGAGWQFTKAIANMALIIVLAWIAFATILRIRSYEVKTLLPKLLIVALLINFIPVIMGVIVDVTNIITKYFSEASQGAANWFWNKNPIVAMEEWNDVKQLVPGRGGLTGVAAQALAGIIFNLMSFGALIGYSLVFIIRIAAIEILAIIAPLCWLGYIIPSGKKYWHMWWNQFILWSIIGIPMLFFLYIAGLLLQGGMTSCPIDLTKYPGIIETIIAAPLGHMLCQTREYLVAIIIMIVGAGISMTLMPRGAAGIVNTGKKATKWMQKTATAAGKQRLPQVIPQRVQQWAQRQAQTPVWGTGVGGARGALQRAVGRPFAQARWAIGGAIGEEALRGSQRKLASQAEASIQAHETPGEIAAKINQTSDWAGKVGYINKLIKEGDLDDAIKADPNLTNVIAEARKRAKVWGGHKEIESAMPHLAEDDMRALAGLPSSAALPRAAMTPAQLSQLAQAYIDPTDGIINRIKPARAGQVSAEAFARDHAGNFLHPEVLEAMSRGWDGRHVSRFIDTHGALGATGVEDSIKRSATAAGQTPDVWLQANNPRLLNWMRNNPAAQGFFTI